MAASAVFCQVREHPAGKVLPHDNYIRVVSEQDSPAERVFVRSRDGLSIPAVIRKPKGPGPFPALVYFHGAPGGRGMEKLVSWSLGTTGGPLWERFLQEGYVVVVADYRNNVGAAEDVILKDRATYVDDGVSIVEHVQKLPYVDASRISVYGVSRGGNLVLHLIGRVKVRAAVLGAPAPMGFLAQAGSNIKPIDCPVLILVGTADSLIEYCKPLYAELNRAGKKVQMEIYGEGYHDFVAGPQGHEGRSEPLLEATLDALDRTLEFLSANLR